MNSSKISVDPYSMCSEENKIVSLSQVIRDGRLKEGDESSE